MNIEKNQMFTYFSKVVHQVVLNSLGWKPLGGHLVFPNNPVSKPFGGQQVFPSDVRLKPFVATRWFIGEKKNH